MYYGLIGHLTAKAGKGKALAQILLEAAVLMESAPGCYSYIISRENDQPDRIWVTEIWASQKHHDDALKQDGVRELIGQAMPLLEKSPSPGTQTTVLGGLNQSLKKD
jgi:quinol monooxygenase YgiN